jgi:hypothetical protein
VVEKERPVLTGLVALVAVAAVVGALLGVAALVGTRVLGLGNAQTTSGDATGGDSLYLPEPQPTRSGTGPLITLAPGEPTPTDGTGVPSDITTKKPKREISLSAGQTSVGSFQRIDLTGVYALGEGAILQVQRNEGGTWQDFPVTMSVSGGSFSTYVQTSQPGVNEFRVIDTDTGTKSNSVKVRVG